MVNIYLSRFADRHADPEVPVIPDDPDTPVVTEPVCGNDTIEDNEMCDGTQFIQNMTECSDFDAQYVGGSLKCNSSCMIDFSDCKKAEAQEPVCGNNTVEDGEMCDGTQFIQNMTKCSDFSAQYSEGSLKCNSKCIIDFSDCTKVEKDPEPSTTECGNNILEGNEMCDGTNFVQNITKCSDFDEQYSGGNLKCSSKCLLDFSDCTKKSTGTDDTTKPSTDTEDTTKDHNDGKDSCSAAPLNRSQAPWGAAALALFGFVALIRRRRV